MAIQVQMNDDITKYDTKVIGPLNKRELKCSLIAVGCALPGAIIAPDPVSKVAWAIGLAAPALLCGWVTFYGLPFEMLFFRFLYMKICPVKRKYHSVNIYQVTLDNMKKNEEKRKIAEMSPKERKKYQKLCAKKNKVIYSKMIQNRIYR